MIAVGRAIEPELTGLDESELVRVARAGDEQAFHLLHARYERIVRAVVAAETRNPSDVGDLVQEVFVLAWTRIGSLRDPRCFRAWLLQIARRAVIDHGRAGARRPQLDGDAANGLERVAAGGPGPEDLAELGELVDSIGVALDRLSRREVVAITLAAQFGMGPAEIAEALQITPNNAKVVLHRARRRLRALVA